MLPYLLKIEAHRQRHDGRNRRFLLHTQIDSHDCREASILICKHRQKATQSASSKMNLDIIRSAQHRLSRARRPCASHSYPAGSRCLPAFAVRGSSAHTFQRPSFSIAGRGSRPLQIPRPAQVKVSDGILDDRPARLIGGQLTLTPGVKTLPQSSTSGITLPHSKSLLYPTSRLTRLPLPGGNSG
jgi:hypothetical protein